MRKIVSQIVENIEKQLFELSSLVNIQQKGDYLFVNETITWLKKCEIFLKTNNYPESSTFATLRSKLLMPGTIIQPKNGLTSKRKQKIQLASDCLIEAQNTLSTTLKAEKLKLKEARDILEKLVLIALQQGLFPNVIYNKTRTSDELSQVWTILKAQPDFKQATSQILLKVSLIDVLKILDELFDQIIEN